MDSHDTDLVGFIVILALDIAGAAALPVEEILQGWCLVTFEFQTGIEEFVERITCIVAEAFLECALAAAIRVCWAGGL